MQPVLDYSDLLDAMDTGPLVRWRSDLRAALAEALGPRRHGDLPRWQSALASLPAPGRPEYDFSGPVVSAGAPLGGEARQQAAAALMQLHPWRKGPLCIAGIDIDTEWRSDWKWERVAPHLAPLQGRRVLDVGCGNGYYGWRMLGAGAQQVIGLDPTLVFVMQYWAVRRFTGPLPHHVLPVGVEALSPALGAFDSVFSMGVLYHRREPVEHLRDLYGALRPGGQLVLETLVVETAENGVLVPSGRYAQMRNVWALPTPRRAVEWLAEAGFERPRCVDVTVTSVQEQRSTAWMRFKSLADYLDPQDPARTVEGHPAPRRAVFVAERPA